MNSADTIKAEKIKQFWDAYRACVETYHILPRSCLKRLHQLCRHRGHG
jgi:hypothetical protein